MTTHLRVASFNVNGIRARFPSLVAWLQEVRPDLVCLQETKVQDAEFPRAPLEALGYQCAFRGEKGFNGVAVLSRTPIEVMGTGLDDGLPRDESRLILVRAAGITWLNTYVPQGTAPDSDRFRYKIQWFERLRAFMERAFQPRDALIWMGDFNVAPEPRDVYDPERLRGEIGFHPEEHRALEAVCRWGWVDVFRLHVQERGHYTFWDYRIRNALARGMGWRVDHIWATALMARRSARAWIDVKPRSGERPSDHAPILAEFELD
jgi:exodeoxyribonuclease-3